MPVSHAKFKPETKLSPPQGQPTGQGEVRGLPCVVSSEVCVSFWVLWGKNVPHNTYTSIVYISMLASQFVPSSPSPAVSSRSFSVSVPLIEPRR